MLLTRFRAELDSLGLVPGRALVAVSGGPDSVALLDLLVRSGPGWDLVVAHVDHGIHPDSAAVAARVEALAARCKLSCQVIRLHLGIDATETRAREQRYAALEAVRVQVGAPVIMTGHHADDQAETVLLRVLLGTGPAGLAAMASRQGAIVRPLLSFRRAELAQYVRERGLESWDDPANRNPEHLRSWLRGSVLPVIRERLPEVDEDLLRVAAQAGLDRVAWDRLLDGFPALDWRGETDGGSVAVAPLATYDSALGAALLRAAARRLGLTLGPSRSARALEFLRRGQSGKVIELGGGWTLALEFGRARFGQSAGAPTPATTREIQLGGSDGKADWGRWMLHWSLGRAPAAQTRDGLAAWFIPGSLRVRPWQAGDSIRPLRGRGRRLVVKCFQEARVGRAERSLWPVFLDAAGDIVWVPGVCRSENQVPEPGAEALRVDAQVT